MIPSSTAARMTLDPASCAVFIGADFSYFTDVQASHRGYSVQADSTDAGAQLAKASRSLRLPITPDLVKDLSDEDMLVLLNEHVRRAVESPGPKMMARIKDVLQPIILHRLEWRAANGQLAATLTADAKELQDWIVNVAPWHPKPKPQTVENNIRDTYNRLKPRSRPTNP